MIGIYKITNPKGKVYIGQSIDIKRRFKEYSRLQCSDSKKIYYSLSKYGVENHKFEILEECFPSDLEEKEKKYILKYNSIKEGLNIKMGDKPSWTGAKRPEHSKWLKENGCGLTYERTDFHKKYIGKKVSESWNKDRKERSKKISKGKTGKGLKPIICNETQQIFSSIKECSEVMSISKGCICSFVKGKYPYPTLRGYTFKYFKK